MGRFGWLLVAALVGACGDDGNNTADAGTGSGSDSGDSMGGALLISGMGCDGPFSFHLGGDERLLFGRNTGATNIKSIIILDGPLFDYEDETAWPTYAQSHDVFFGIGLSPNIPLAVGAATDIFDPFFAGRGVGIVGFAETGGSPVVEIVALDTTALTTTVTFTLPVSGSSSHYPPMFDMFTDCPDAGHTATGSYTGAYQVMDF